MKIAREIHDDILVLAPQGAVTGADAEHLAKQLTKALQEPDRLVVLDASGIPYVDSRGLEALVDATELLIRHGRALKVSGANGILREVMDLTEVASLFEQFDDLPSAVGSCR